MKTKVFNIKYFVVFLFLILSVVFVFSLNLRSDVKDFNYFKIAFVANEQFKEESKSNLATVYLYSNETLRSTVIRSKEIYSQSLYFFGIYTDTFLRSFKNLGI